VAVASHPPLVSAAKLRGASWCPRQGAREDARQPRYGPGPGGGGGGGSSAAGPKSARWPPVRRPRWSPVVAATARQPLVRIRRSRDPRRSRPPPILASWVESATTVTTAANMASPLPQPLSPPRLPCGSPTSAPPAPLPHPHHAPPSHALPPPPAACQVGGGGGGSCNAARTRPSTSMWSDKDETHAPPSELPMLCVVSLGLRVTGTVRGGYV